jgi:DNA polymerase epsilon subunit 2
MLLKPSTGPSLLHRARHQSSVLGTAESRILAIRDRLNIIKQTILRNEHFAPSTIPSRDREHLLTASLTSVLPLRVLFKKFID